MSPSRDQLIDLILRETTDEVTADGVQIAAPNILEVGCRYVRGDPKRGYENPAEAARQFAGFIADAVLSFAPVAVSAGKSKPLAPDAGGCVTKRFVIFTRPGMAPEKKGGWLQDEYLIEFLRDVMIHDGWTPGFRATVLELTWDNDLWASSASEYLSTHDHAIGPRRARKAWREARDKHERIYKSAPSMPLGQEIAAYHRLITPPVATKEDDKLRIAIEALERISGQPLYYERDTADGPRRRCPSCAHAWPVATPEHHAPGCTRIIASEALDALKATASQEGDA